MGNIIVKNASELVTCSGFQAKQGSEMSELHTIKDGAVVIKDGIIQEVGKTDKILSNFNTDGFEIIDASGKAVLPGFVDSHTHFVFGGYRANEFSWRLEGQSYMEIMNQGGGIQNTVNATREASFDELMALGEKRLNSMLSFGVTTVEGKSGYGLDHENEIKQLMVMKALDKKHPIDVIATYLGAHAVPTKYKGRADDYLDYLIEKTLPHVADENLAQFCDIFCEKNVFTVAQSRRFLNKAKKLGFGLKIHADEIVQSGGTELAAELGAASADHLLQASDNGIDQMAENNVVATLLPGTAFCLREPYAPARKMIDHKCAVALATDFNPGSCFTESIPLILAIAILHMNMSIEEAITAMTINGAAALKKADAIGSIDKGKKGDLVILEFPSYQFIPYHTGVSVVERVIKDGTIVFEKPSCPAFNR